MGKNSTKEQIKEWNRIYYLKNKEKRIKQYSNYTVNIRKWFNELKATLSCSNCGASHPAVICFHHKDKSQKVKEVSIMATQGNSIAKIKEEIAKCEALCHNCHAILHYEEREKI